MDFYKVITAAVADMTEHGFDDLNRVQMWLVRIRRAAIDSLIPERVLQEQLAKTFRTTYKRLVENGGLTRFHPGIPQYTIDRVKPKLRAELDRRIMASADLIRLNRVNAIEKTLQRFSGWATSIPMGGTDAANRTDVKKDIKKALAGLPFEERRVAIDQGHKFVANLNNIVATDGGAIAAIWHSHYRQPGYNYRPDHKDRDGRVYMIRGNWALERGLVRLAGREYYDQITAAGEEVYCRCFVTYIYSLGSMPADMLTSLGKSEIQRVRALLS